jgi:sugar-specific transcriptional regulator TrmB/DNA-binding CsgD family transcriptional regulator
MLEAVGIDEVAESIYGAVLRRPGSTASALAISTGVQYSRARAALGRLQSARLIQRLPRRPAKYAATPPDVAVNALANERQHALDSARLAVPGLLAEYRRGSSRADPGAPIEVISGPDAALRRFRELQKAAVEELLGFDRLSSSEADGTSREVEAEASMLERGVRCRAIYETSALNVPARLQDIRHLVALGEQARAVPRLPLKLAICDRKIAMLPLITTETRTTTAVMVYSSALLDGLVDLFEAYWQRGVRVSAAAFQPSPLAGLSQQDYEVLELLQTGLKDETIARQLGVSMRTARRRISRLLTALGVGTRFQAGAEAARQGLV